MTRNASDILRMFAEKSGVKISTGVSVEAVEGDGHVSGVRLSDGPGDSCGSCRCIGRECVQIQHWLRRSDLMRMSAVKVNERMETSVPNVYACE